MFSYTGEGQSGDMDFTRGNLALRDHLKNGKRVFLFESGAKGFARFICEVEVFETGYLDTPDTSGKWRRGIQFVFKRSGVSLPIQPSQLEIFDQVREPLGKYGWDFPNETERRGLVTSRVGQGVYRKRIVHRWEYQCAVTGFDKLETLIASHIVPWAQASDNERLDVYNGILLSPTYDALFDRHLITFENSGKIVLSDAIEIQAYEKIGVTGKESIRKFSEHNFIYLENHRGTFAEIR